MIKAYPRVWVDLTSKEVALSLLQILNPISARSAKFVRNFEDEYAKFIGTEEAVSFPNCRSALYHSIAALGFKDGDEAILPAFTFWVDAEVVVLAGLRPVFVDAEFDTLNIDAKNIEAAITERTRLILPAHLNGLPADMDTINSIAKRYNLRVLEDCARTCGGLYRGCRVGSFDIGAFSFGYGKSFYGFGGGMVTSNDRVFMARLRELKREFRKISIKNFYQAVAKGCVLKFLNTPNIYRFTLFPMAYRYQIWDDEHFASWFRIKKPQLDTVPEAFRVDMYDLQAKTGFRQIRTIDITNKKRKENMKILNDELAGIPGLNIPVLPADREHVCVHYAIWTERKRELQRYLFDKGIDAQDESAEDVTQMERFKAFARGDFPNAGKLNGRIIYLPAHPSLGRKDMIYIAKCVKEFFAATHNDI